MTAPAAWMAGSLMIALALAGCADGAEDIGLAEASLSFDGSGTGSHEDSADCDDEATLTGGGNVEEGMITVTVTDGGGDEVYSQEYETGEFTVGETSINGASGSWALQVTRSSGDLVDGDFRGNYDIALSC